jgi:hypothetical protein
VVHCCLPIPPGERPWRQLCGRAGQQGPLLLFGPAQGLALEPAVEVLFLLEDVVDDARELLGHERACDGLPLASLLLLVPVAHLGIVLDGSDGRVTEGQLQVAIALA